MKRTYETFKSENEAREYISTLNPVQYTTSQPQEQVYGDQIYWCVEVTTWALD